jgi:hypothetical protein
MSDGTSDGIFNEVNIVDDPAVRNIPTLQSFTITAFTMANIGSTF